MALLAPFGALATFGSAGQALSYRPYTFFTVAREPAGPDPFKIRRITRTGKLPLALDRDLANVLRRRASRFRHLVRPGRWRRRAVDARAAAVDRSLLALGTLALSTPRAAAGAGWD